MFYGGTIVKDDLKAKIIWCSKKEKGIKIRQKIKNTTP